MNKMNFFFLSAGGNTVVPGPLMLWRCRSYCFCCWWWWLSTFTFSSHIVNKFNKHSVFSFQLRALPATSASLPSPPTPSRSPGGSRQGRTACCRSENTLPTLSHKNIRKKYLFVFQGYRVYFLHDNFTSVQTVRGNKSAMIKTITRLGE